MLGFLKKLIRNFSTFLLAIILSLAVWVSAVSASDPTQVMVYPTPVRLEIVGLDPGVVLVSEAPRQVSITLSAPQSIWNRLTNETSPIRAIIDLSGLRAGIHEVPVQVQVGIRPIRIVSYEPEKIDIYLEELETRTLEVSLVRIGEPAVGFQAEEPEMNLQTASIRGSSSLVQKVNELRAPLDITNLKENIERRVTLQAIDEDGLLVEGVSIIPDEVVVTQPITQRGGFRNVVVKVIVTGQVGDGYRVTNLSVYPPAVTVFSSDPKLVDQLPGYVETNPLDLNMATDDIDIRLFLDLPPGITVVGEEMVEVQVGVAAIEGSITISSIEVEVTGLKEGLAASVSPGTVDVILSGPLPVLDAFRPDNIRVYVELTEEGVGTYQRLPKVDITLDNIVVESILPGSLEIVVTTAPTPTPTPRP